MRTGLVRRFSVILPAIIGLAVICWLFYHEFNPELFHELHFSVRMCAGLLLACLFMAGRDGGQMYRFRLLSDRELSWKQAFRVNMLCEFTSAATPSAVGGSSLIILFLNREGINAGKSTALMMACLFLDELFLTLVCPLLLLFVPLGEVFGPVTAFASGVRMLFWVVYACIALWTLILFIALFRKPEVIKRLLLKLFALRWLRKWKHGVEGLADNLVLSSHELRKRSGMFWWRAFGATCLSWISRYLVVNALLIAFTTVEHHFLAFARQLVLWIVMVISPTPGGSGIAEYMFKVYYADFFSVAGMALVVAFVWRVITFYLYLVIGAVILPKWIGNLIKLRIES